MGRARRRPARAAHPPLRPERTAKVIYSATASLGGFIADLAAQRLDAGLLDEVLLFFAPVFLGDGTPVFGRSGGAQVRLERLPGETGHWYRVVR